MPDNLTDIAKGLADTMKRRFTPPEFIPGCKVTSVADISQYATNNGWVEAICGQHNQQRCRWRGQYASIAVDDYIDVMYFPDRRLFEVHRQGGSGALSATVAAGNITSGTATDGYVLTADGAGAADWEAVTAGDVVGPGSATDTAIALYDGTTGKLIKDSGVTVDGSSNITTAGDIYPDGQSNGFWAAWQRYFGSDVNAAGGSYGAVPLNVLKPIRSGETGYDSRNAEWEDGLDGWTYAEAVAGSFYNFTSFPGSLLVSPTYDATPANRWVSLTKATAAGVDDRFFVSLIFIPTILRDTSDTMMRLRLSEDSGGSPSTTQYTEMELYSVATSTGLPDLYYRLNYNRGGTLTTGTGIKLVTLSPLKFRFTAYASTAATQYMVGDVSFIVNNNFYAAEFQKFEGRTTTNRFLPSWAEIFMYSYSTGYMQYQLHNCRWTTV